MSGAAASPSARSALVTAFLRGLTRPGFPSSYILCFTHLFVFGLRSTDRGLPTGHRDHGEGRERPGPALLPQGGHYGFQTPPQDGPEPRRPRYW
jgi:hypothetical protein